MNAAADTQPHRALNDAIAEQASRLELLVELERKAISDDAAAAEQLRDRVRRVCGDLLFAARVEPPCACTLCRK